MSDSDKSLQDMEEGGDGMTKYGNMMLEFIKKEIFEERKNISVEEVVTLVAALTDLSVSLLSVQAHGRQDRIRRGTARKVITLRLASHPSDSSPCFGVSR